jgi:hypothetical protein
MEAILNGLPSVGPLGKVAHVAGRIMLAKMALEVSTGLSLSGTGIDAILAGKPVWLKPNERARLALRAGRCTSPMPGSGRSRERLATGRRSISRSSRTARVEGSGPGAERGRGGTVPDGRPARGQGLAGVGGRSSQAACSRASALVYHGAFADRGDARGRLKQRPQAAGSGHGAAPSRPPGAKAAVVSGDRVAGPGPKAEHRQEPTPAQRAEAWTQIDEIQTAWQALGSRLK